MLDTPGPGPANSDRRYRTLDCALGGAPLDGNGIAVDLARSIHGESVCNAENRTEAVATNRLRTTWFDRLGELTGNARTLASSYRHSDSIMRPNIPYVYTHFDNKTLAAGATTSR